MDENLHPNPLSGPLWAPAQLARQAFRRTRAAAAAQSRRSCVCSLVQKRCLHQLTCDSNMASLRSRLCELLSKVYEQ